MNRELFGSRVQVTAQTTTGEIPRIYLKKTPEDHRDARELHKAQEIGGVILPAHEQPPFPPEPGKKRSTSQRRSYRRRWRPS